MAKSSYHAYDTIFYPVRLYGSSVRDRYYIYEKPLKKAEAPVVYSFGTGVDPSFSEGVLKRTGARVYAYSDRFSEQGLESRIFSLKTLAESNHHDHIDLLKMDIEGREFEALRTLKDVNIPIDQICMKTHEGFFYDGDQRLNGLFDEMHGLGYVIIYADKKNRLYTFLKRNVSEMRPEIKTYAGQEKIA